MTLTATELTRMRTDAEDLLPSTCTIQTLSTIPDGMGGVEESWSDIDDVPCRLDITNWQSKTAIDGDQFSLHDIWLLYVHWDQAIASGNRVVFDGDTYDVLSGQDHGDWRMLRQVLLQRVSV